MSILIPTMRFRWYRESSMDSTNPRNGFTGFALQQWWVDSFAADRVSNPMGEWKTIEIIDAPNHDAPSGPLGLE